MPLLNFGIIAPPEQNPERNTAFVHNWIINSVTSTLLPCFSNRKGKLIFFYEWDIKLKWKGTLTPEDPPCGEGEDSDDGDDKEKKEFSGEIEIPNLSEENDPEEIDVSQSICMYIRM